MPTLPLAYASSERALFPDAITLNCLSEKSATVPSAPEALIARFGLDEFENIGEAPLRGIFQRSGLLDDAAFVVAKNTAYVVTASGAVTTLTGTIPGDDLVEIDGGLDPDGNSEIRIATGSGLYRFVSNSGAVAQEDFPEAGGSGATSVAFWAGYWIASQAGTDFVYYINPGASTWTPLEFAAAEYKPDKIKGIRVLGDLAWLLGAGSTEAWRLTGDGGSPMEPAGGLKFDIGCRNIAAAVNCKGTLIWVTDDCSVVMTEGGPPSLISDFGLSEQIRLSDAMDLSAGFFVKDQHPCYVLHLGTRATWVYDLSSGRWSRFASLGLDYWRPRMFANLGETVLCTDRNSNALWVLDPDNRTDAGEVFQVEFCGFLDVPEGVVDVANIELDCLTGLSPMTGQGSDPLIGLRLSRDGGRTFGDVRYRPMGRAGQYTASPRWNALGMAKAPHGIICKWEISDPVGRRFSTARYNVP